MICYGWLIMNYINSIFLANYIKLCIAALVIAGTYIIYIEIPGNDSRWKFFP